MSMDTQQRAPVIKQTDIDPLVKQAAAIALSQASQASVD